MLDEKNNKASRKGGQLSAKHFVFGCAEVLGRGGSDHISQMIQPAALHFPFEPSIMET